MPLFSVDPLRALKRRLEFLVYCRTGLVPRAQSYPVCKDSYIQKIIRDEAFLGSLQEHLQLRSAFGVGLDERVVEYPWVFSKLLAYNEKCRFLDAGSTLNHGFILNHPLAKRHKWTILTLAPEPECFCGIGVSYVYDDMRVMPFRDECFDGVFCVSVIEHIGMDNTNYVREGCYRENKTEDYIYALNEMKRVLKPDGWLFLTVPFGLYENHGWLQQFDSAMLSHLISNFQPKQGERLFYRSTSDGWQMCAESDCDCLSYRDPLIPKTLLNGSPNEAIHLVSASGLACIALQK